VKPVFDAYSDRYDDVMKKSIGFFGRQHDYYTQAKVDSLFEQLKKLYGDTESLRVLDIGCGVGKTDAFVSPRVGTLCGVDVSAVSIERARVENPQVEYKIYDGKTLPYEKASFDVVFLICVLHHVDPAERLALLRDARRVVRLGGAVFIFEHNPFHPLTQLVVARCEFDRDAQLLSRRAAANLLNEAGWTLLDAQHILFLPFRVKMLRGFNFIKRAIPFGTQHVVSGVNYENHSH